MTVGLATQELFTWSWCWIDVDNGHRCHERRARSERSMVGDHYLPWGSHAWQHLFSYQPVIPRTDSQRTGNQCWLGKFLSPSRFYGLFMAISIHFLAVLQSSSSRWLVVILRGPILPLNMCTRNTVSFRIVDDLERCPRGVWGGWSCRFPRLCHTNLRSSECAIGAPFDFLYHDRQIWTAMAVLSLSVGM